MRNRGQRLVQLPQLGPQPGFASSADTTRSATPSIRTRIISRPEIPPCRSIDSARHVSYVVVVGLGRYCGVTPRT